MTKTEDEIYDQIDKATETEHNSKFPGMSYEAGVKNALDWVLGNTITEDLPMDDKKKRRFRL